MIEIYVTNELILLNFWKQYTNSFAKDVAVLYKS